MCFPTEDPKPSGICPRQNGYYPDRDPTVCDKFVQCTEGKANPLTCPAGLVFSLKTSTCRYPDEAGRTCNSKGESPAAPKAIGFSVAKTLNV